MEDRETPRMHKYGESKTTRIMMATVRHVTAWVGRTKYQAAWFLLNRVYNTAKGQSVTPDYHRNFAIHFYRVHNFIK